LLVIIGGPPGSGNTSRSRRLARDRGWPVLGSDDLARTIAGSAGLKDGDAYWIAYDVAFAMADPSVFDPPRRFRTDPRILAVFDCGEAIDASRAMLVDAERTDDEVYATVARLVAANWPKEAEVRRG
jgi:hypothetical protein